MITAREALCLLEKEGFIKNFSKQTGTPVQTVYSWRRKGKVPFWRLKSFEAFIGMSANDNGDAGRECREDVQERVIEFMDNYKEEQSNGSF